MTEPIKVDIWSDIACPWCFIGKRKFEAGVAAFAAGSDTPVEVEYHSFELAPDTPVDFEGSELDFLVSHKGMPAEQITEMLGRVTGIAAQSGLEFNFDKLRHTNTVLAHQALHFAKAHGKQRELAEVLFRAYFTDGKHVGNIADLAELGATVGLDAAELTAALEADRYLADVRADQAQAQGYGIQGVPFFVIDGKYGVSGAQEAQAFEQVLTQVSAERGA
ncbi:DsbA family oxidoreductase [Mycetocola saprophilus]|uniref:DsbA family oxidoreductase n=1 Tax=Mycetocola saprophilus TaxID=76636 RepID=UPI0004C1E8D2|nr:DsbA family oxidoreductase [Mycetocola saprophilus]